MTTFETYDNATRKEKKENAKKRKKNTQKIIDISVEAKKQGMSYGQYVAKYGV